MIGVGADSGLTVPHSRGESGSMTALQQGEHGQMNLLICPGCRPG